VARSLGFNCRHDFGEALQISAPHLSPHPLFQIAEVPLNSPSEPPAVTG
jgi:hypothetical protein